VFEGNDNYVEVNEQMLVTSGSYIFIVHYDFMYFILTECTRIDEFMEISDINTLNSLQLTGILK
jgi:hypothetical protein